MIRFHSTNGQAPPLDLADALLTGLAPDRGLYVPEPIPPGPDLESLRGRSYPEVAAAVLAPYAEGVLQRDALDALCADAYDFAPVLQDAGERRWVMRLDAGPTASFKDFAAQLMGRLMGQLVRDRGERLVILTATSGDTGSAVARAFSGVEGVEVGVLFPVDEVSERQRLQMTTIGGNVHIFGVSGKFDDCQALVKRAFADPELASVPLSSANSINIGRLLPQSVYYGWAWLQVAERGERVVFSVPCGNFGNLVGGMLAHRAGLPVSRFIVATNANDEVPRFLATGVYDKLDPSRECLSNAMNVGHPSNLARLVHLYGGQMDHTGRVGRDPDHARLQRDLWATSVSDDDTRSTIGRAWKEGELLLEPHGAVAWEGLRRYRDQHGSAEPAVSLETAHPAKFPEAVRAETGIDPELPPSLQGLDPTAEQVELMDIDYGRFRARVAELWG